MTSNSDALLLVSADCHAGASLTGYRGYLERRWLDDFDAWAATFTNPFADLDEVYADRNWDSAKRLRHLEEDGIAGEVLFPNTVPPFYPSVGLVAGPPSAEDYARRWAGLQAHNRWLADFCDDVPGRRAGIAQILFNEPADAVAEITAARERGLFGGLLLPAIPPGAPIPPIWDSSYDPIWDACEDLDVPINHHGGSGTPDYGWELGMARVVYLTEFGFYSNRNVWHMIWGGVFERHPQLRYVVTEQGFAGVLDQCGVHDYYYAMLNGAGDDDSSVAARELVGDYIRTLPMKPSDYLRRNCWMGASFMSAADAARRVDIGVERVMWGSDYPHTESTWPDSRGSIAAAIADVPIDEARRMLGLNAVDFYGFDRPALDAVAARIGPRPSELITATEPAPQS
jgi:predicted TIM-barrel fold metal-dependent hydrolase